MRITVTILCDIPRPMFREPFPWRRSRIVYDAKAPVAKKLHCLLFQQGAQYGQGGDCCDYLTHDELLTLEQQGLVRINGRIAQ